MTFVKQSAAVALIKISHHSQIDIHLVPTTRICLTEDISENPERDREFSEGEITGQPGIRILEEN